MILRIENISYGPTWLLPLYKILWMQFQGLQNRRYLIGYGVTCTGCEIVGVYKVEMEFNRCTRFITKVEIGSRDRIPAAKIIDLGLDYYINNMNNVL